MTRRAFNVLLGAIWVALVLLGAAAVWAITP